MTQEPIILRSTLPFVLCHRVFPRISAFVFLLLSSILGSNYGCQRSAFGGDPMQALPSDDREEGIQTPAEYFGFEIGSRHLRHDQVYAYFQYLCEESDRMVAIPYGQSHGKRPLAAFAITHPETRDRLNSIQKERRKLTSGMLKEVPEDSKLVMYIGYCVHGDEASAINAAPLVAYHLCSSKSNKVLKWLKQGVYLVDPALNPDGVDRFANWANENRGKFASPLSISREHNQPWPGGRTNYYWCDLNRDWLPLAHPESQGRVKLFHQWKPNVVLDFHEMGGTATFFFQPGIPARTNPQTPQRNQELTHLMALEHAKAMDQAHELYFTEEQFDDFYMGKGSTYPDLHGAVGILFEQGSTRGLRLINDVSNRHFRDTVANQVRTTISSLEGANKLKTELLEFQRDFYEQALQTAQKDALTGYILTGSPSRIQAARSLLNRHAIRTHTPTKSIRLGGATVAIGESLVIPTAQPEISFVRSLMETRETFEENLFYDVSTWHFPSALDLAVHRHEADFPEDWLMDTDATSEPGQRVDIECAGYAIRPEELSAPKLIASLMKMDVDVRVSTLPMRDSEQGTPWPAGTFLILRQPNEAKWKKIQQLLGQHDGRDGIVVKPILSSMTKSGPDLGSSTIRKLPRCNPLLVVGTGTTANDAGAVWHFLDTCMAQSATLVDTAQFSEAKLDDFSCVVMPNGTYSSWSERQVLQLKDYVRNGGTLVAIGSAISWLQQKEIIAQSSKRSSSSDSEKSSNAGVTRFADAADAKALETIAGAFFMARIDSTHPMGFGFPDEDVPVFRDSEDRFDLPANPYQLVAKYSGVISGYVSNANRSRLISSAAVWVHSTGKGRAILIADNPVFRGYVRSSERFLTNALLLGPIVSIPTGSNPGSANEESTDDDEIE